MLNLLRNFRKANECEKLLLLLFLFITDVRGVSLKPLWQFVPYDWYFHGHSLEENFFLGTWAVLVDVMILSENYWTWKIWQDCLRIQVETTNYTYTICSLEQMYHFSNK